MLENITAKNPEEIENFESIREEAIEILTEFESETYFMDEGGAGKVYELPGGLCMKVLIERHLMTDSQIYNLGNSVAEETKIQEQMARTDYSGETRVPKTFAYLSGTYPVERSAILMEKLDGVNLQHILNGTKELPESFDVNKFFDALEDFIDHMHRVEKIAHLDLYARNIMVDNETSVPYVIDFGRSERLTNSEEDKAKMEHDWQRFDEVLKGIKALQDK